MSSSRSPPPGAAYRALRLDQTTSHECVVEVLSERRRISAAGSAPLAALLAPCSTQRSCFKDSSSAKTSHEPVAFISAAA